MRPVHLRCHLCGTRAEVMLTETDQRKLQAQGFLTRHCKECRGETRWDLMETLAPRRLGEEEEAEEPAQGRMLLIDDDESILAVLEKALSRERVELECASSAREAVTLLARGDYDLVLSDIRMPDFDGKQLFQFLDEHLPQYKERVIFLTGDTGNPATQEFLAQSQRPYLTKPLDIPALLRLVRESLSQK